MLGVWVARRRPHQWAERGRRPSAYSRTEAKRSLRARGRRSRGAMKMEKWKFWRLRVVIPEERFNVAGTMQDTNNVDALNGLPIKNQVIVHGENA